MFQVLEVTDANSLFVWRSILEKLKVENRLKVQWDFDLHKIGWNFYLHLSSVLGWSYSGFYWVLYRSNLTVKFLQIDLCCGIYRSFLLCVFFISRLSLWRQQESLRVTRCASTTSSNSRRTKPVPRMSQTPADWRGESNPQVKRCYNERTYNMQIIEMCPSVCLDNWSLGFYQMLEQKCHYLPLIYV